MNLFECIGGGNSELQETVLWTNSSPTSSFANQVVTLSDDIDNYDYIKFYFRVSTSNSASQNVMAPVSDFKNLTDANTSNSFVSLSSPNEYTGSYRMVRRLNYVSATSVRINASVRTNGQGSDDTLIIPTAICGLKYAKKTPIQKQAYFSIGSASSQTITAAHDASSFVVCTNSPTNYNFTNYCTLTINGVTITNSDISHCETVGKTSGGYGCCFYYFEKAINKGDTIVLSDTTNVGSIFIY